MRPQASGCHSSSDERTCAEPYELVGSSARRFSSGTHMTVQISSRAPVCEPCTTEDVESGSSPFIPAATPALTPWTGQHATRGTRILNAQVPDIRGPSSRAMRIRRVRMAFAHRDGVLKHDPFRPLGLLRLGALERRADVLAQSLRGDEEDVGLGLSPAGRDLLRVGADDAVARKEAKDVLQVALNRSACAPLGQGQASLGSALGTLCFWPMWRLPGRSRENTKGDSQS